MFADTQLPFMLVPFCFIKNGLRLRNNRVLNFRICLGLYTEPRPVKILIFYLKASRYLMPCCKQILPKVLPSLKLFKFYGENDLKTCFFSQNAGICLFTIFSSAPQISMTFNLVPKISTEFEIYKLSRIKYLVVSANMRTCIVQKYNISIIIMLWCSGSGTVDIARI